METAEPDEDDAQSEGETPSRAEPPRYDYVVNYERDGKPESVAYRSPSLLTEPRDGFSSVTDVGALHLRILKISKQPNTITGTSGTAEAEIRPRGPGTP